MIGEGGQGFGFVAEAVEQHAVPGSVSRSYF